MEKMTFHVGTEQCIVCGKKGVVELTSEEYFAYVDRHNLNIQAALPELCPDKREQLISGIHPVCWTRLFGE